MTNRELRERAGMSVDAMSRLAGVTPYWVKAFEDGEGAPEAAQTRLDAIYGEGLAALLKAAGVGA